MSDNLVFVLPGFLEEDLFALPVMMHYLATRIVVGRDPDKVTLVCKNPELFKLADAYWKDIEVVTEPKQEILDKADLVFYFDSERAYELGKNLQKHIGECYGIQLGVGLMRILPPMLVEDEREIQGRVLVAERNDKDRPLEGGKWPHASQFMDMGKEKKIPMEFLYSLATFDQTRHAVGRASVVVGPRSTATLLAAAAGKLVFELNPDSQFANWMGKFENGFYKMVYGKLDEMTGDLVWAGLLDWVQKIKQPRKAA